MKIKNLEIRGVAVEAWPPGIMRCHGPHGRFIYVMMGFHTVEIALHGEPPPAEWAKVHLIDGDNIELLAESEEDAVIAAGERVGQDISHLVREVEWV